MTDTPTPLALDGASTPRRDDSINLAASIPFLVPHLTPLLLLVTGVSRTVVLLLAITFWGRMFCITGGYHRYFAHRTYRLARLPQLLLAFGGTTAAQKGPLWWAAHHRDHHRWSDTELDVHSPQRGFWWSHVGWILCDRFSETKFERIPDFARFPELRFLNRHNWIGPWTLAVACFLIGGWSGLVLGFFVSTVLLWHATFCINSLAHVFGRRRYATDDTSRNSALLAVLTMGEGWHNNHHAFPSSCRNGFRWWEWDPTYYALTVLSWVGIVRGIKAPPRRLLATNQIRSGAFDIGMFRAGLNRAERTVHAAQPDPVVRDLPTELSAAQRTALAADVDADRRALEAALAQARHAADRLAEASRRAQREAATDPAGDAVDAA